jgi:NADH dehydrogenase FAD-containing subunit
MTSEDWAIGFVDETPRVPCRAMDEHLRSAGNPAVFAAGDCVAFQGRELPRIGVQAIRRAPVLFRNLFAALDGRGSRRFKLRRRCL